MRAFVFDLPTDDDLDVVVDPAGLFAESGMCVSRALKKLYSCTRGGRGENAINVVYTLHTYIY